MRSQTVLNIELFAEIKFLFCGKFMICMLKVSTEIANRPRYHTMKPVAVIKIPGFFSFAQPVMLGKSLKQPESRSFLGVPCALFSFLK